VRALARKKAFEARVEIGWIEGHGDRTTELVGSAVATRSSGGLQRRRWPGRVGGTP